MVQDRNSKKTIIRISSGDHERFLALEGDEFLIGRDEDAEIRVPIAALSRRHAIVRVEGSEVYVKDLGSANGTFVEGRRLRANEEVRLTSADKVFSAGAAVQFTIQPRENADENSTASSIGPSAEPTERSAGESSRSLSKIGSVRGEKPALAKPVARQSEVSQSSTAEELKNPPPGFRPPQRGNGVTPSIAEWSRTIDHLDSSRVELDLPGNRSDLDGLKQQLQEQIENLNSELWEVKAQRVQAERELTAKKKVIEGEIARLESDRKNLEMSLREEKEKFDRQVRERWEVFEGEFAEAKKTFESELHARKAELEQAIEDLDSKRAELERENDAHKDRLSGEIKALRLERNELDQELGAKREFVRRSILELEGKRDESASELSEVAAALEDLARERDKTAQELNELRSQSEKEFQQARDELHSLRAQVEEAAREFARVGENAVQQREEYGKLENLISELREKRDRIRSQAGQAQEALAEIDAELTEKREHFRRENETREYEIRRTQAYYETLEAEFQVKKLGLEAALGEIGIQKIEAKKNLQIALYERDEAIRQTAQVKAESAREAAQAEERLGKLNEEALALEKKLAVSQGELDSLRFEVRKTHEALSALKKSAEVAQAATARMESERKKVEAELAAVQSSLSTEQAERKRLEEAEMQSAKKALEDELSRSRKLIENELLLAKNKSESELTEAISNHRKEIEADRKKLTQELEHEFAEKLKQVEREVADVKLAKLAEVEHHLEEARGAERKRREFMLSEIVRGALALSKERGLDQAEAEFKRVVRSVLEGKTLGALSAEANARTKRFWKKVGLWTGGPMAAVILFISFGVPQWVSRNVMRTIASERKEGGVFLDEIKQRGVRYQPPVDRNYRDDYADNVLYLEGYPEMKLEEQPQKKWILILNDFIVGKLGQSDRIIPEFMAAETGLVKELLKIKSGILPQFKDQGIVRMNEAERQQRDRMISLLGGEENYLKFRDLEKSFYLQYIEEKGR